MTLYPFPATPASYTCKINCQYEMMGFIAIEVLGEEGSTAFDKEQHRRILSTEMHDGGWWNPIPHTGSHRGWLNSRHGEFGVQCLSGRGWDLDSCSGQDGCGVGNTSWCDTVELHPVWRAPLYTSNNLTVKGNCTWYTYTAVACGASKEPRSWVPGSYK